MSWKVFIAHPAAIYACQKLLAQGGSNEDVIFWLRKQKYSKVESIGIISKAMAISVEKAKEIIHASKAWADVRKQHDEFHASLEQALNQDDY